jgi:plasmid maintenance system antidote protein VapI
VHDTLKFRAGARIKAERAALINCGEMIDLGLPFDPRHVNELCKNRRNVTARTALILARVFGNSPDFWLNVQRRNDLVRAALVSALRRRIFSIADLSRQAG